jgi:hypothetical protein
LKLIRKTKQILVSTDQESNKSKATRNDFSRHEKKNYKPGKKENPIYMHTTQERKNQKGKAKENR